MGGVSGWALELPSHTGLSGSGSGIAEASGSTLAFRHDDDIPPIRPKARQQRSQDDGPVPLGPVGATRPPSIRPGSQILVSGVWIMQQVPDDDQDGATESPNRYPACRRRRRLAVGDKRCMSVSSSDPIVLSDAQRQVLLARARETRGSIATWCVPGLCLSALTARPTP